MYNAKEYMFYRFWCLIKAIIIRIIIMSTQQFLEKQEIQSNT